MDSRFKNVHYPLYLVNDVREPSSEILDVNDRSFLPKKWILGLRMYYSTVYPLYLVNDVRESSSEVLDINDRSF